MFSAGLVFQLEPIDTKAAMFGITYIHILIYSKVETFPDVSYLLFIV